MSRRSPAPTRLDPFTRNYVRKAARGLAGKHGFGEEDHEEIQQHLYEKLAPHLGRADSDSPRWRAFVARIVRRHLASLVRNNLAAKRDHRRLRSLDTVVSADACGPVTRGETLSKRECDARRGRVHRSAEEQAAMAIDVSECLAEIDDPRMREVCRRLMHDSLSQVARDMGIPRTTLRTWLDKLRTRFEERGLKGYLEKSSSLR